VVVYCNKKKNTKLSNVNDYSYRLYYRLLLLTSIYILLSMVLNIIVYILFGINKIIIIHVEYIIR